MQPAFSGTTVFPRLELQAAHYAHLPLLGSGYPNSGSHTVCQALCPELSPQTSDLLFHTHTNNLNSLHYSCLSLEVLLLDSSGREVQAAQTALTKGVQYQEVPCAPLEAGATLLACGCCSGSSYPLCASNGVIVLRVLKTHYNFSINQVNIDWFFVHKFHPCLWKQGAKFM